MICKICGLSQNHVFSAKILRRHEVKYFYCSECGFLQTETPYWLDEAYLNPINVSDTGYLSRNIQLSRLTALLIILFFDPKGKYLDYAGGYGVFVRLMRDIGVDFYWWDKYAQNLFAQGFAWDSSGGATISAVTSFESFEHFDDPMKEIRRMVSISGNLIFTTEVLPVVVPRPEEWWYYGLDHGQHISFYSEKTLRHIANLLGLKYYHSCGIHLLTKRDDISVLRLQLLKLERLGIGYILSKVSMKSITWADYLKVRQLEGK